MDREVQGKSSPINRIKRVSNYKEQKLAKIYSAFFVQKDEGHCTWEFAPGACTLPFWAEEGSNIDLVKVGVYLDNDVVCDIVEIRLDNETIKTQKSGTLLHITTFCKKGVSPVQSGLRATKNGFTPVAEEVIPATAGFFEVED